MENLPIIRKLYGDESKFIYGITDYNVVTFGHKIVSPFDLNDPKSLETIDQAINI